MVWDSLQAWRSVHVLADTLTGLNLFEIQSKVAQMLLYSCKLSTRYVKSSITQASGCKLCTTQAAALGHPSLVRDIPAHQFARPLQQTLRHLVVTLNSDLTFMSTTETSAAARQRTGPGVKYLPAPENGSTAQLDVSTGETIKLDSLGPLVGTQAMACEHDAYILHAISQAASAANPDVCGRQRRATLSPPAATPPSSTTTLQAPLPPKANVPIPRHAEGCATKHCRLLH